MNNPVTWFEIGCVDLERAKSFYAEVFEASFEYVPMPDAPMYMFAGSPESIGAMGALVKSENNSPSADGTIVYFGSEDVAVEAGRVDAAGGKLLFPKTSIGEFGFIAQFMDTEGNRIGLHSNQ
ncbi:MAG: VOC family protein [Saprospiraceae bacterium]|nr:VOC family protein [Saprospiraceae bacterium]MBK7812474.1 VOC family protein [Saprospiraceae bacterium]MBK9632302.1 VOC family protein [Saprospiraceae bacterium]